MAHNAKYTESPYIGAEGKVLRADRAYLAPTATANLSAAAAGAPPGAWIDQGSIDASKITLDKADSDIVDVTTGLFEVLRAQVAKKDGELTGKYTMVEYDPNSWSVFTGDATSSIGAGTNNRVYVGSRPLLQKAALFVGENAATGTEFQHYSPKVNLTWKIVDINDFSGIEVTVHFLKFNDGGDAANLARDFVLTTFA